jgi:hypothetical protein
MKRVLAIVAAAALAAGCSPAGYALGTPFNLSGQRHIGPAYELSVPLPIGRWDNVMLLPPGAVVQVLMIDGAVAAGPIVSASADGLRMRTASGNVDLSAERVMRVDRPTARGGEPVRAGARGAAFGAGVVGVLGLVAGHVPPPRLFLAGGIVGAQQSVELYGQARRSSIVYLAPSASPAPMPHQAFSPR